MMLHDIMTDHHSSKNPIMLTFFATHCTLRRTVVIANSAEVLKSWVIITLDVVY